MTNGHSDEPRKGETHEIFKKGLMMKSINLLALPGAAEFSPAGENVDADKVSRVSQAMHGLLDRLVKTSQLTGWHKDNPTLHAYNIERPALVETLRAQAGMPIEGEEPESWRLMLARYKRPGISSLVMHYTVYLGPNRFMDNGLDVNVLNGQIHAGNGMLADRQLDNVPVNIADVPGVDNALVKDIALIQEHNGFAE